MGPESEARNAIEIGSVAHRWKGDAANPPPLPPGLEIHGRGGGGEGGVSLPVAVSFFLCLHCGRRSCSSWDASVGGGTPSFPATCGLSDTTYASPRAPAVPYPAPHLKRQETKGARDPSHMHALSCDGTVLFKSAQRDL